MIDAYIWIGVWVVILIMCIVELGKVESRLAEDRINKMFAYLEKRKKERLAMPRYIGVEDAVNIADEECGEFRGVFGRIKERLEAIPTVDVVEVVRCKDCKHCEWYIRAHYKNGIEVESHECRKYKMAVTRDWFCADGERIKDGSKL